MSSFGFVARAKVPVTGYMQAVSDDGKITIYGNEDKFFVYFFDGEKIIQNSFRLEFYANILKEKYFEEAVPSNTIYTRLIDSSVIVVYVIGNAKRFIAKVVLYDRGEGEIEIQEHEFDSPFYDVTMHPTKDCLAVLKNDQIHLIFVENFEPDFILTIDDFPQDVVNGQLQIIKEGTTIYYYPIYTQTFMDSLHELQILKIQELKFAENYVEITSNYIEIDQVFPSQEFKRIKYQPQHKIFGISYLQMDPQNSTQQILNYFIDDELNHLEEKGEVTSYLFHDFIESDSKILLGSYYYYASNIGQISLSEICLASFTTTSSNIKFDEDEEICLEGNFDRVGVWNIGNQSFILTQIDQYLTIRNGMTEELETIKAYSFSTQMDNVLIVDSFAQLEYLQWKQVEDTNIVIQEGDDLDVGIILGFAGLITCIFVLVGLIVYLCYQLKQKSQLSKIHSGGSQEVIREENPYFNKIETSQGLAPDTSKNRFPKYSKTINTNDQKDGESKDTKERVKILGQLAITPI